MTLCVCGRECVWGGVDVYGRNTEEVRHACLDLATSVITLSVGGIMPRLSAHAQRYYRG